MKKKEQGLAEDPRTAKRQVDPSSEHDVSEPKKKNEKIILKEKKEKKARKEPSPSPEEEEEDDEEESPSPKRGRTSERVRSSGRARNERDRRRSYRSRRGSYRRPRGYDRHYRSGDSRGYRRYRDSRSLLHG